MSVLTETIRTALRIKTDKFDSEIDSLIEGAKIDLWLAGIEDTDNKLSETAIIFYCRANFGQTAPAEAARWEAQYEGVKAALAHSTEFGPVKGEDS